MIDTINRHISMIINSDYIKNHVNTPIKNVTRIKQGKETVTSYLFPVRVPFKYKKIKT